MIRLRVLVCAAAIAYGAGAVAGAAAAELPAAQTGASVPHTTELRLDRIRESLTGTHRHYQQFIDGIEVVGGEMSETLLREGAVQVNFDRSARVPGDRRSEVRGRSLSLSRPTSGLRSPTSSSDLVYVNVDGEARLAHRVVVERRRLEPHAHYVDAITGELLRDDPLFYTAKQGRVFDVNPVAKLNLPSLMDQNDSASAVPAAAYSEVDLPDLNPAGPLTGPNVQIVDLEAPFTTRADASGSLDFDRSQPQFEEVNAYFQLDRAQRYLQSLGYTGSRRLVGYSIPVDAHAANGTDNSYYIQGSPPGRGTLYFGDGGTEDAEDSDIMLHEFGHAIHDWIIPGGLTGTSSSQARAVSEGFGDYWSFSSTYALTIPSGRDPFCIADWDARCAGDDPSKQCGYPPGADCLRRVDSTKTMADYINSEDPGTEHKNGMIWSSALREIFMTLIRRNGLDAGKRIADTIVLESLFSLPPAPDFRTVARSMVAADRQLRGGSDLDVICSAMTSRGIFAAGDCGNTPRGEWTLFQSPDQQIAIPDGTGSITSTISVSDTRAIAKLAVRVDIAHPSRGDLVISLVAPNGTTVRLKESSNTDRTPDVHATFGIDAPAVDPLDVFNGQPANGTWKLVVSDVYAGDAGTLQNWDLLVDFAGDAPLTTRPTTSASRIVIPVVGHAIGTAGTQYTSDVYLLNRGNRDTTATLIFTPSGVDGTTAFAAIKAAIAPGQTIAFTDIVASAFASTGLGWLEIQGDTANLLAWSEAVNSGRKTAQSIEATSSIHAAGAADAPLYLFPMPGSPPVLNPLPADIYVNFGVIETAGASGTVHVAILDPGGATIGTDAFSIQPFSHTQRRLPLSNSRSLAFTTKGDARILPYGSIVLLGGGDAIYVPAGRPSSESSIATVPVSGRVLSSGDAQWIGGPSYMNILGSGAPRPEETFYPASRPTAPVTQPVGTGILDGLGQADIAIPAGALVFEENLMYASPGPNLQNGEHTGPYPKSEAIARNGAADTLKVESTADYRTNFGVSEADGATTHVRVTLFDASGRSLASTEMILAPRQMQQIPISALYGGPIANGRLHFEVLSGGRVFGYVSVLNNTNNDSVFELAR